MTKRKKPLGAGDFTGTTFRKDGTEVKDCTGLVVPDEGPTAPAYDILLEIYEQYQQKGKEESA